VQSIGLRKEVDEIVYCGVQVNSTNFIAWQLIPMLYN